MSGVKRYGPTCDCMSEMSWGEYVLASDYDQLRTANQRLEGEVARMREALEHARLFIRNGIDLGCIRMPDADTPDPAHHTLPMINAALSTANDEVTE